MRKGILFGGLLLTMTLGVAACGGAGTPTSTLVPSTPTPNLTLTAAAGTTPTTPGNGGGDVVSVHLADAPNYAFDPATINLESGKTYTLQFNAPAEFHTFTVESLGIDIFVNPGEAVSQQITPNTVGEHALICLPHQALGMVGKVIVS